MMIMIRMMMMVLRIIIRVMMRKTRIMMKMMVIYDGKDGDEDNDL